MGIDKSDNPCKQMQGLRFHVIWQRFMSLCFCIFGKNRQRVSHHSHLQYILLTVTQKSSMFESSWNSYPFGCSRDWWKQNEVVHPSRTHVLDSLNPGRDIEPHWRQVSFRRTMSKSVRVSRKANALTFLKRERIFVRKHEAFLHGVQWCITLLSGQER